MKAMSRSLALLSLALSIPCLTLGCYGTFPMTNEVYDFNGDVGNNADSGGKIIQTGVFWVLTPVYVVAMVGDAVIFNMVEFWSGETVNVSQADTSETIMLSQAAPATQP